MKTVFTKHATLKLKIYHAHRVKISPKDVSGTLDNPQVTDKRDWPIIKVIGALDEKHSLVVLYKAEDDKIIVITFWPAAKGRYESKIQ